MSMMFILFEILEIPLLISFSDQFEYPNSLKNFHIFITSFFFFEIFLNFNTGFYSRGFKL